MPRRKQTRRLKRQGTRSNRRYAKKGGYTSFFPTKDSELAFIREFIEYMATSRPKSEKIARATNFFKSVLHLTHVIHHSIFLQTIIAKLNEFGSEKDVQPEFHENRLQALEYLESFY